MKSLLQIILCLGLLIIQLFGLSSWAYDETEEMAVIPQFPWEDAQIQVVRVLSAKPGSIMLCFEFDKPLRPQEYKGRDYALVKWIREKNREVEINELLRGTQGILPAIGFIVDDFNLSKLLPSCPQDQIKALVEKINRLSHGKCVDTNKFTLSGSHDGQTALIVMPFMSLMSLEDFIDYFGAQDDLVTLVEKFLGPTFNYLMQERIVHGDLALRNVGVIFKECGPFKDYNAAFSQIAEIVLYDFGGKKTRILNVHELFPENEKLVYLLQKIISKIGDKLPRVRRAKLEATSEKNFFQIPSPLKLMKNQGRPIAPAHIFPVPNFNNGDGNPRVHKKIKLTLPESSDY